MLCRWRRRGERADHAMDGWVTFRAICRGDGRELVAPTMTLIADTTARALTSPAPGATVKDDDHDPGGVQVTFTGRSDDADVAGEPVTVMIDGRGQVIATTATTPTPTAGPAAGSRWFRQGCRRATGRVHDARSRRQRVHRGRGLHGRALARAERSRSIGRPPSRYCSWPDTIT
jgi:hypothetical protein